MGYFIYMYRNKVMVQFCKSHDVQFTEQNYKSLYTITGLCLCSLGNPDKPSSVASDSSRRRPPQVRYTCTMQKYGVICAISIKLGAM